jgi:hypothetical protein
VVDSDCPWASSAGAAFLVALALREPSQNFELTVPDSIRFIWFGLLALVVVGAFLKWGKAGAVLARWSLFLLAMYCGAMWLAHQTAIERAAKSAPVPRTTSPAAWPTPANPMLWQAELASPNSVYTRYFDLGPWAASRQATFQWREMKQLDGKFIEALRTSEEARIFLDFTRYPSATVEEQNDGYRIAVRDGRYSLWLYASLNRDLGVESVDIRWLLD